MTNKEIKIYPIGESYGDKFAIRVKDIPDIEEARNIMKKLTRKWQDNFTDEEYIKKFGHEKVVITNEEKSYVRNVGRWVEYGYEYKEYDFVHTYEISEKGGRGAMLCWVFNIEDRTSDYFKFEDKG